MRSTNPVCTSNPEDTTQPLHDFPIAHLLIGTNREHGKADHIGVFESLIKGSEILYRNISRNRQTAYYRFFEIIPSSIATISRSLILAVVSTER